MKKKHLIFTLLILFGLGALIYFTKPTKKDYRQRKKAAAEDIMDTVKTNTSAEEKTPDPAPVEDAKENKDSNDGTSSTQTMFSRHGESAVLKAKDKIKVEKEYEKLPVNDPDWSKPLPLTFRGLKKIYMYRKLKNKLPVEAAKILNGSAVQINGALMPLEKVPKDGSISRFWLANPVVVMAGCVFCNPPTLADLIFVEVPAGENPLKINRERLYTDILMVKLKGQFFMGSKKAPDGTVSLFQLYVKEYSEL